MNRLLVAHTPVGKTWWATSLQGEEEFSSLYEFRLELKSEKSDIDMQSLIGEACSIACEGNSAPVRYFSGHIIRATSKGKVGNKHWLYELLIAPKLWYASRRADFKIFQNKTVQAIADEVLQQNAINCEWRLKNSYKTWEYVVQYGETDLAFLLRLLGNEGIYFWFEHEQGGEKLILGDHFSVHEPFAGYGTIPFYPPDISRADEDHFHAWNASRTAESGKFVQTSYDFKHPSMDLETECTEPCGHLFDQYEMFAYPGTYTQPEKQNGQEYATARLHGLQIDQDVIVLEGMVRGVVPGCRFTLDKHPVDSHNRDFFITKAEYRARNNDERSGGADLEDAYFLVKVSAIPANRQYRTPSDKYVMPRAHGPDTAVVVGPSGEIHDDEYGRVKVHFHWDRYGQKDGSDSCWIRVASPWAGTSTGMVSVPRIGQEVVVSYEHGDPQRPLITGSVYNAQQMPPWGLPASNTQSGFKSHSTPGGGADNFNGLRFENAAGAEEVWLQAEKDQRIEVKNDESTSIGANRTETVGSDETINIGANRSETVGSDETINIGANRTEEVGADETITIGANRTEGVGGNESITIGADRTKAVGGSETDNIGSDWSIGVGKNKTENIAIAYMQNVGAARMENVGLAYNLNVGAAQVNDIGGLYSLNVGAMMSTIVALKQSTRVGSDQTTKVGGNQTVNVSKSQTTDVTNDVTIKAGDSITLVVGKSKLVMKKDGTITLNGKDLSVGMTGDTLIKTSGKTTIKSTGEIIMKGRKINEN
jgi:type VI secretion system secreted protein VgrG